MHGFITPQHLKNLFFVFLFILVLSPTDLPGMETHFSKEETLVLSNVIGLTAITTWGMINWDYFKNDPKKKSEGWFSDTTKNGGMDKLGHFYFAYTLSRVLAAIYEDKGYSTRQGAALGALSSFGMATWMEIGDAFSHYGFAYEDFIMNLVGSVTGYVLRSHPGLSEKIDFRIEYQPKFNQFDISTDYDHQKFLMALKFDGFHFAQTTILKYLELHLGYYARGYPDHKNRERNIYVGIGINISRLFKRFSMPKTARVFNYIQLPYTDMAIDRDLNR
ncbi:DUF2279 domain-containing protein [Desulfobacula sp.]|uniref:DUF2279 domain-containing protein n=1 Tax=Desulfobacula sp. TaxID=2593537 RepID=UPI00262CE07D|nr:DUF2279 domain-containing protein [Desulfobacula sp.]